MSSIRAELGGETEELLARLRELSAQDRRSVLNSLAEGLRTSVLDRFDRERDPQGKRWKPSIRAQKDGGKTLTVTNTLRTGIHAEADEEGLAVGTNDIRAATHQFGDERTIRRRHASVRIRIPPRPFLGINEEDEREIQEALEELFED